MVGLIFILTGFFIANKSIRIRFNGKVEKLEGTIISTGGRINGRGRRTYYIVVEYFDGYKYVTHRSSLGTRILLKRIGDKVTVYKNAKTGEVAERTELYGSLLFAMLFLVVGLANVIESIINK